MLNDIYCVFDILLEQVFVCVCVDRMYSSHCFLVNGADPSSTKQNFQYILLIVERFVMEFSPVLESR